MITQRVISGCRFSGNAYMLATTKNKKKTHYHLNETMMTKTASGN